MNHSWNCVLKTHDVTVVNKPFTTLQQQFPAPKFRPSMESQSNSVYKIPCTNCSWCYIGETGRAFNTRKKEHLRNTKTEAKGARITNHAWSNNHATDFENASIIIDKPEKHWKRGIPEWHLTQIINYYWTRLSKITWFVNGEPFNYLPKPKAEAND